MTSPLTQIGDYASQIGAEIVAFDDVRKFLYVVSGGTVLQVLEFSDPTTPREVVAIDLADYGVPIGGVNSVAYRNGLVAIAVQAATKTDPGFVAVVNVDAVSIAADIPAATKVFTVGSLPDMVTFTPDGTKVLVANEGEPDESVDPEGSISIIDVSGDFASLSQANVATASFQGFNDQKAAMQASGVRIFPDATVAQDVEPEYIAVSPDGTTAFVTLQENNAIAIVDIATATVTSIKPLGLKDFSLVGNGIDASDRDGGINIKPQPVFGLYMPDAIAAFESNGETFYLIANEGDDRGDANKPGRGDAIRLKDIGNVISFGRSGLSLDPALEQALNANGLLADSELGRLTISSIDGDTDGDGDIDRIVSYGGRSFSVLDSKGNLVFDSGDQIERLTAALAPELFNANDGSSSAVDTRSDNKGPEPETVTTGVIDGKLYAFVGLERAGGGVLVYDLSNPRQPEFVQYVRSDADFAPEGLTFIAAEDSPNAQPLLVVANEGSNTVAIYQASDLVPPASTVFVSEFHYDNDGTDTGEFIEITATAGTDLTGWQVVLYNGNNGAVYDTQALSGVVAGQSNGLGTVVLDYPSNGIQNGSPDGIALVNPAGTVVKFLSYEGSFTAVGGPADGLVSANIGAAESGSTPIGQSLQLIDGVWTGPSTATKGIVNVAEDGGNGGGGNGNGGNTDTPIYTIQGEGHTSALADTAVVTSGVVTAVDSNGFYLQDLMGDGNIATSDALFVFTGSAPTVTVGDGLRVAGTVSEFTPGGVSTGNLSTTQISGSLTITVLSSGNALPAAVMIGAGGRVPPSVNIDDDAFGSFDPVTDGIDFFESLEGMRVTAEDLLVVNGTNRFGEIFAVANRGANATGLSDRATLNISPDDFNPERIQINQDTGILPGFTLPSVNAGALLGGVTGVVGYSFGNFEILPTEAFSVAAASTLTPEVSALAGDSNQLTVASYNVLNFDINDADGDADVADGRLSAIAQQIINNLKAPDIIGLQEIQDNSGSADDGVTAADATLQALVDAIAAAGGPNYSFIDNTFIGNNTNGGQPGGNIRTAFLYNPARVSQVGAAVTIGDQSAGSPFSGARLPLVATFSFNGEEVTVVNNHFSSKGGSAPILGTSQDFADRQEDTSVNGSLNERREQAQAVNNYVDGLLATNAAANVVVLGDMNEFEFVSPLQILAGTTTSTNSGQSTAAGGAPILTNLINSIPENERYSFIFQGNSQALDHILVSNSLANQAEIDIVHLNSEFADSSQRASDHDPVITRLTLGAAPVVEPFKLQLLHLSDQEAGISALDDAPRASAVINALRNDYANTLLLSSGDAFIPGLFASASTDIYGGRGRADILIQNELGLQAIAFGNHDFDFGTAVLRDLIAGEIIAKDLPIAEAQEVGTTPVDTASTGRFTARLSGNRLNIAGTYSNLTSALRPVGGVDSKGNPASAVHIHTGVAGANGAILRNLTVTPTRGSTTAGQFSGTFDLTDAEVATLVTDGLYVNLQTENNPGGELRGQIDIDLNNPANFVGTKFPYLSSNLDFSTDSNLADLVVPDDQPPQPNSIAASVVIDVNGEKIGVVGATTPLLRSLSSPGNVGVSPQPFDGVPTAAQLDALTAEIQKDVDELIAANPGLNKVVLLTHMQQISIEQALATRLKNVDVIVAGGSNTRLLDDNDRLRPSDTKQGEYPVFSTDADGKPVAIVNTDGNYKYVGRLVVDFDANGNIIPGSYDSAVSGAYATDAQGVADLNAQGLIDPEIQAIVEALRTNIIGKESNVFGLSDVYLNGDRSSVRIEETNFGNLTADANLVIAKQTDATTVISLKNGGGLRNSIGQVIVPTGSTGDVVRLSNEAVTDANGNIVKPTGGISQNDIANTLSFNNGLTLVTVTAAELLAIIEHGVAASTTDDSNTPGQFPQVAGIEFSFDLTQPPSDRVQSLVVLDENGKDADIIVRNGALVGDPNRTFRMVTLNFLARGSDGYQFPTGPAANIVDLVQADSAPRTGAATFAADGSEQDALAEYFAANFSTTPFDMADAPRSADTRIQNLAFRADTVIDSLMAPTVGFNSNNLLATTGNAITQLKATLSGRTSETVGEIIAIATDDENGTIDGQVPGSAGYQAAALARATVLLSALSASEFGSLDPMRTIDVMGGKFLQFATIKGGTLGDLINGRGGEIIFATPAANSSGQSAIASPNALNDQSVQVSFRLPGSNRNDITLDLTLGNTPKPLGSEIQGENAESEIIDLTGIAAPSVNATIEVFREASFNNVVGFYGIEDKAGTVIDPLTGNALKPGDAGYVKAALANRVDLTLTGENGRTSQFSATLATGKLLSTFLVVDGTIGALLDTNTANDPTIYFNHIGMNSDGKDHVRLLGDNTFGFEDLAGGGDMDFDDVIVKMSFV